MYFVTLALHSLVRWLVLASLLYALYRSYRGWLGGRVFLQHDNTVRHTTATIAHVQMTIGVCLYFISPVIDYFLHHFKDAVHERQIRFFGMEHSTMMLAAVVCITIGSAKAKRKVEDRQKFRTMAIWFTMALLIILASIPWPFSPLVSRPYWRGI
jgi:hypothetical protein